MAAAIGFLSTVGGTWAAPQGNPASIAIVPFDYEDTSGELRDQTRDHNEMLQTFVTRMGVGLEQSGRFTLAPMSCLPGPCSITDTPAAELVDAARRAGARYMLFGGIHKMSTLVQFAKAQVIDLQTERIVFDHLLTFRGDDQRAWHRAQAFLVRDIASQHFLDNTP